MKFIPKSNSHWKLALALKILRWVVISNLAVLAILWILRLQNLFILILAYEAFFILIIGVLLILSTYVYRKDSIPSRAIGEDIVLDGLTTKDLRN